MVTTEPKIDPRRLRARLLRMLEIYSPSGKEEEITISVARSLTRRGLEVLRQKVDGQRHNLIVPLGPPPHQLALVGHLDTVPAHDLDDRAPRVAGDIVTGLGSSDMKGGCAAIIEVAVALAEAGCRDLPVVLCLVVGEEEEGDGSLVLVNEVRARWAIVAEPTDLVPCLGQVGYVEAELSVSGTRRHASLADLPDSAVNAVLRLVLELSEHFGERRDVVMNVRELTSSPVGFFVPDRCAATIDLHVAPELDLLELTADLRDFAEKRARGARELDFELSFELIEPGFVLREGGELVEAARRSYDALGLTWAPAVFRSHSDASTLKSAGFQPLIVGPGRLEEAHAPGESVDFRQVVSAAELYLDLILGLSRSC